MYIFFYIMEVNITRTNNLFIIFYAFYLLSLFHLKQFQKDPIIRPLNNIFYNSIMIIIINKDNN